MGFNGVVQRQEQLKERKKQWKLPAHANPVSAWMLNERKNLSLRQIAESVGAFCQRGTPPSEIRG